MLRITVYRKSRFGWVEIFSTQDACLVHNFVSSVKFLVRVVIADNNNIIVSDKIFNNAQ